MKSTIKNNRLNKGVSNVIQKAQFSIYILIFNKTRIIHVITIMMRIAKAICTIKELKYNTSDFNRV